MLKLNYNRDWSQYFYYDETSPTYLRWSIENNSKALGKRYRGDIAGSIGNIKNPYPTVKLDSQRFAIHRIIYILHNGHVDNSYVIDHIDGNSKNNSINNLRAVSEIVNMRNKKKYQNNNTGVCGVYFCTNHRNILTVCATWYDDSSGEHLQRSKSFSTLKYGLLPAFANACAYREQKIKELNQLGAGYTEKHGKDKIVIGLT
jgi:hypothetical protein